MNVPLYNKLLRGSLNALILQVAGVILVTLFHIQLARVLSIDNYGRMSYLISLVTFLGLLAPLGLSQAGTRFAAFYHSDLNLKKLKCFTFFSVAITVVTGFAMAIILYHVSFRILPAYIDAIYVIVWCVPAIGLVFLISGILRGMHFIADSVFLNSVFVPGVLLFGTTILLIGNYLNFTIVLFLYLYAQCFGSLTGFFWLFKYRLSVKVKLSEAEFHIVHWMRVAMPMIFSSFMVLLFQKSDMLILGTIAQQSDVALYSAASKFAIFNSFILNAVHVSASPLIASAYYSGKYKDIQFTLDKAVLIAGSIGLLIFIFLTCFCKSLLKLFGPEYINAWPLLIIIAFGHLFNSLSGLSGALLIMTGYEKDHAKITAFTAFINIVGNLSLIPMYGALGAAIVTCATAILWNSLMIWMSWRRMGIFPFMRPSLFFGTFRKEYKFNFKK